MTGFDASAIAGALNEAAIMRRALAAYHKPMVSGVRSAYLGAARQYIAYARGINKSITKARQTACT